MRVYHGSWNGAPLSEIRLGFCVTDEFEAAMDYADGVEAHVWEIDIDMDGLIVHELDEHPNEEDWWCIDHPDDADIVMHPDCSERGRPHTTMRIMSYRALERLRIAEQEAES